jgi:beta-xylosidase
MFNWERHSLNPMFSDPGHARDSYILKDGDLYYFYYTRTFNEVDLRSCVAVRTSPDLKHWSGPKIVHTQAFEVDWGGDAESPFVIKKDGLYYLFICRAMTKYNETHVYWSETPDEFPIENFVCELATHASEIIQLAENDWYISNTGWDKKGLFIAKLEWK